MERYTFYLANELARLGCDVHYVTGVSDVGRFDPRVGLRLLPFLDVPMQERYYNVMIGQTLGGTLVHLKVREALSRERYDVVHGNTNSGSIFSLDWAAKSGAKSVFTVHNTTPRSGRAAPGLQQSIRRATFRMLDAPLLRSVDHLVTFSASSAKEIEQLYGLPPSRITTIPPGVDMDLFQPGLDASRVLEKYSLTPGFVLAVGRLVDQKGFADFVRSLQGTHARGVLVGDGPNFRTLQRLNDRLLRPNQLAILRTVPPEDLPGLYSSAAAYVFTSVAEGLPSVGVEALASGLPLLGMSAPGVVDLIDPPKNGLLTEPGDVDALGKAIQQVLDDRELCRAMGSASRSKAVENYSWRSVAAQTLSVYRTVLAASH